MRRLAVVGSLRSVASVLSTLSVALILLLFLTVGSASAQNAYGTLSNFDVINDTGGECHGFEIELEGVRKEDVAWVFGAPWNRYGDPTREDKLDAQGNVVGAYLRYRSPVDPVTNSFLNTTRVPPNLLPGGSGTITPTDGHACYAGGPVGDYNASGCEHFGLGFVNGNPTKTVYRWLIEDPYQPGQLITSDTKVSIPAVTWNVQPPAVNQNPIVRAALPAEPQEDWACSQFGEAQWVKVFKTEAAHQVRLENLLTDDPEVPQDASETEVEWVLLQAAPTCDENGLALPPDQQPENELILGGAIGAGSESVTRRYEFYKYTGVYGSYQDSHEAFPVSDTNPADGELGDYIGAQMAAVNIVPPLSVVTGALEQGEVGLAYVAQSLVSGGVQPYSVTVVDGAIPTGLVLDPMSGVIAGTPTESGSVGFILDVIDATGSEVISDPMIIDIAGAVGVSTSSLPAGTSGQTYSAMLFAAGGVPPYAWSKSAGSFPSGLTLSASGMLAGRPSATGTFTPTFRVTDALGATAEQSLSLTINAAAPAPLGVTTSSLPQGTKGKPYSATLAATGGITPYAWALASGSLPGGLSLNASSGTISGTPSATGAFSFTVRVTDNIGATATKSLSLTVAAAAGTSGSVDIKGSIGAIDTNGKYFVVGGVNIYWNATTTFALNTDSGKKSSTGTPPAGVVVGMAIQGKGNKDSTGKITATTLEIN